MNSTEHLQIFNKQYLSSDIITYDLVLPTGDLLDEDDTWSLVGILMISEVNTGLPVIQACLFERFFAENDYINPSKETIDNLLPHLIDSVITSLSDVATRPYCDYISFHLFTPFGRSSLAR